MPIATPNRTTFALVGVKPTLVVGYGTWYQQMFALAPPADFAVDDVGRQRYVFNVAAVKRPSETFVEEIVALLQSTGVGKWGETIFASSSVVLPSGDGPYLSITEYGGAAAMRTQEQVSPAAYERPTAQIVTRAKSARAARDMARQAYAVLDGVRNRTI